VCFEFLDANAPDEKYHTMSDGLVSNFFVLRFFLLGFFALTLGAAKAEPGIVTWKEQAYHADATAKAFYFESMKQIGPVTFFYQGDRRMSFERQQPFDFTFIPGSLTEVSGKTASDLKIDFEKLSGFALKYPAAGVMLKARLEQMSDYLKNYQAGEVYVSGKWVSLSEYEKIVAAPVRVKSVAEVIPSTVKQVVKSDDSERDREKPVIKVLPADSDVPATVFVPVNHRQIRLATCAVYLVALIVLASRGKGRLMLVFLFLPLIAAFGWFTYEADGLGWTEKLPEKIKEIPALLGWPGQAG